MSELATTAPPSPAPAPADADDILANEEKPESQNDVIRIFNNFKRDAQMIISKAAAGAETRRSRTRHRRSRSWNTRSASTSS